MRKTNYIKKIQIEDRKYRLVKLKAYLLMKCAIGKREREKRAFSYKIFKRGHSFDKFSNALPDPYYYKPTDIVLYDLIHKEHLKQTNNGVIRLFRNCYTHKYIGISRF